MLNIDAAVQAAMKKAEQVLGDQKKLRDALTTTSDSIPRAAGAVEQASLVLGEEQVAVMLDGAAAGGAANTFEDARKHLDLLNARLPALRARLTAGDRTVLGAAEELSAACNDYTHRLLAEYQADLVDAAQAFAAVLRRGSALGHALGLAHVAHRFQHVRLEDPVLGGDALLINLHRSRLAAEGGRVTIPAWQGDAAAEQIVAEHAELVELRRCLSNEAKKIGERAERQQLQDEALYVKNTRRTACLTVDGAEDHPKRERAQQLIDAHVPLQTTRGF